LHKLFAFLQPPPSCTDCKEIFKDVSIYRQHMADKHGVFIKNRREDLPSWWAQLSLFVANTFPD
jgi:hypothetical protein